MKPSSVLTFATVGLLLGGAVVVALKLAGRNSDGNGESNTDVQIDPIERGATAFPLPMPILKPKIDEHVALDPIERGGAGPILVQPPVERVVVKMPVLKQSADAVQQPTPQPVIQRAPNWEAPSARD